MRDESYQFLHSMLTTPSVTGAEQPVARLVRQRMEPFADKVTTDLHGNTIVALNPTAPVRVMLAGHVDQIGLMVKYVTDEGFLYFSAVGGVDLAVLPGSKLTVWGEAGPVDAVIGRKPIHLMKAAERDGGKLEIGDLWIDIGARDRAAAMAKVAVGDYVTYALGVTRLGEGGDLIAGPGLDDKVGAFVVMEALRLCHERRAELKVGLFAVATVAEEIGLRGARTSAYGIDPQVGIAVDVTHATDNPGADKKQHGDVKIGGGPVISIGPNINPKVGQMLLAAGKDRPHQRAAAAGATGTDANAMQLNRAGMATGLIGLPNRYMHTQVELCSLSDLEHSAALLADMVLAIGPDTDFVPR